MWRLRKLHQYVDATLRDGEDGVDVQFFYNGECRVQPDVADTSARARRSGRQTRGARERGVDVSLVSVEPERRTSHVEPRSTQHCSTQHAERRTSDVSRTRT